MNVFFILYSPFLIRFFDNNRHPLIGDLGTKNAKDFPASPRKALGVIIQILGDLSGLAVKLFFPSNRNFSLLLQEYINTIAAILVWHNRDRHKIGVFLEQQEATLLGSLEAKRG